MHILNSARVHRKMDKIQEMGDTIEDLKLVVVGHGEHGKDEFCSILVSRLSELKFMSSSHFALDLFIYDALKEQFGYKTREECYEDRKTKRPLWYKLFKLFNYHDLAASMRKFFAEYSVYCGNRDDDELDAGRAAELYDFVVFVDRSKVKPLEPPSSYKVTPRQYDIYIDNNGDMEQLSNEVDAFIDFIRELHSKD